MQSIYKCTWSAVLVIFDGCGGELGEGDNGSRLEVVE